ncbi:MAG: antitoxin MazE [Clostridia bacterium]|nr:antitoxin MazE [Clostridia bacterium]
MSQKKEASRVSSLEDQLKKGYAEMAELNLELAQECVNSDNEALDSLEEKLMESE